MKDRNLRSALQPGDVIEIRYRGAGRRGPGDEELGDQWVRAEIIECEPGAWPLSRLSDNRFTEIRPFMSWRYLQKTADALLIDGRDHSECAAAEQ